MNDPGVANRVGTYGASDTAALFNLHPNKTALDVYLETIGEAEPVEPSIPMRHGTFNEPFVAELYEEETERRLFTVGMDGRGEMTDARYVVHDDHEFIVAHLDRLVNDEPERIVELKTTGGFPSDDIPPHHRIQAQHQLACSGAQVCDVATLYGNKAFAIVEVERDDAIIGKIVDTILAFHKEHVIPLNPPDPQSNEECAKAWPFAVDGGVGLEGWMIQTLADLDDVKQSQKELENQRDHLEYDLKLAMAESNAIVGPKGYPVVTWKSVSSRRFNSKALKEDHPEIYEEFRQPMTSRRFLVTKYAKELGDG